ncbi:hypothetical protein, partial [Streptomyces exfoliatus]|uniref:hypothetical protein n=1 Tax=Streptomyces exfoliatus TaxID=1905 RepID=UPI001B8069BC
MNLVRGPCLEALGKRRAGHAAAIAPTVARPLQYGLVPDPAPGEFLDPGRGQDLLPLCHDGRAQQVLNQRLQCCRLCDQVAGLGVDRDRDQG